jgi:hypothetical protein
MLRKSIWLIGALVLVSASVLFWRRAAGAHKVVTSPEPAEASTDVDRLEKEIASLRYQMGSDRLERARTAASEPKAPAPAEPGTDEKVEPIKPHAQLTERQIIAFLDSKFDVEATDPSWSETARAKVLHALVPHLPAGASLERIECRTNSCRVETKYGNLDQFREFFQASFMKPNPDLWNSGSTTYVLDPSVPEPVAVSFIAREGQNLPTITD